MICTLSAYFLHLVASPQAGAFWESHVFGELTRQMANRGDAAPILYWRTASGPEVDLIIEHSSGALTALDDPSRRPRAAG
jgi:predicted AAA+ superfamily ATPase